MGDADHSRAASCSPPIDLMRLSARLSACSIARDTAVPTSSRDTAEATSCFLAPSSSMRPLISVMLRDRQPCASQMAGDQEATQALAQAAPCNKPPLIPRNPPRPPLTPTPTSTPTQHPHPHPRPHNTHIHAHTTHLLCKGDMAAATCVLNDSSLFSSAATCLLTSSTRPVASAAPSLISSTSCSVLTWLASASASRWLKLFSMCRIWIQTRLQGLGSGF